MLHPEEGRAGGARRTAPAPPQPAQARAPPGPAMGATTVPNTPPRADGPAGPRQDHLRHLSREVVSLGRSPPPGARRGPPDCTLGFRDALPAGLGSSVRAPGVRRYWGTRACVAEPPNTGSTRVRRMQEERGGRGRRLFPRRLRMAVRAPPPRQPQAHAVPRALGRPGGWLLPAVK